jgi:hypothetical protein
MENDLFLRSGFLAKLNFRLCAGTPALIANLKQCLLTHIGVSADDAAT